MVLTSIPDRSFNLKLLTDWLFFISLGAFVATGHATEADLARVIEEHWQWTLEEHPERRLEYGDRSGNDQWTDMSPEAFQRRYQEGGRFILRLEQIEPATLSADNQINRAMLLRQLRDDRIDYEDGLYLIALDMRSGPQHRHGMIDTLPMQTEQDLEDTYLPPFQSGVAVGNASGLMCSCERVTRSLSIS